MFKILGVKEKVGLLQAFQTAAVVDDQIEKLMAQEKKPEKIAAMERYLEVSKDFQTVVASVLVAGFMFGKQRARIVDMSTTMVALQDTIEYTPPEPKSITFH